MSALHYLPPRSLRRHLEMCQPPSGPCFSKHFLSKQVVFCFSWFPNNYKSINVAVRRPYFLHPVKFPEFPLCFGYIWNQIVQFFDKARFDKHGAYNWNGAIEAKTSYFTSATV